MKKTFPKQLTAASLYMQGGLLQALGMKKLITSIAIFGITLLLVGCSPSNDEQDTQKVDALIKSDIEIHSQSCAKADAYKENEYCMRADREGYYNSRMTCSDSFGASTWQSDLFKYKEVNLYEVRKNPNWEKRYRKFYKYYLDCENNIKKANQRQ